jgi:RNA polymerase sigma-70 factor (ECF subfamily)
VIEQMPPKNQSDADLMVELQQGRDGALCELMVRWQRPLLSFTFRYTQNQSDSADVVQETFVRVYQSRSRYRPGSRFSTWLFTIATNLCRNRARWRRRHPTVPLDFTTPHGEEGRGEGSWLADTRAESPDQSLADLETVQAVKAAIGDLPHDLKTTLLLFQYEDKSYQEIADLLGCSVKAVETRLYRARHQLKKKLARFLEHEPTMSSPMIPVGDVDLKG